jgi:hypothetical protein
MAAMTAFLSETRLEGDYQVVTKVGQVLWNEPRCDRPDLPSSAGPPFPPRALQLPASPKAINKRGRVHKNVEPLVEQTWNRIGGSRVKHRVSTSVKSLRSKDGPIFFSAHNARVGDSNPLPATKAFRSSLLRVPRMVKVASSMHGFCSRVLGPCSNTCNNLEHPASQCNHPQGTR